MSFCKLLAAHSGGHIASPSRTAQSCHSVSKASHGGGYIASPSRTVQSRGGYIARPSRTAKFCNSVSWAAHCGGYIAKSYCTVLSFCKLGSTQGRLHSRASRTVPAGGHIITPIFLHCCKNKKYAKLCTFSGECTPWPKIEKNLNSLGRKYFIISVSWIVRRMCVYQLMKGGAGVVLGRKCYRVCVILEFVSFVYSFVCLFHLVYLWVNINQPTRGKYSTSTKTTCSALLITSLWSLSTESNEWFIEVQAFSPSYALAPFPPTSPDSKLDRRHTRRLRKRDGRGGEESGEEPRPL